jgi:hypothetical protein
LELPPAVVAGNHDPQGWITRSSCVVATAVDSRKTAMQVIRFHVINTKQMNSEQALAR